MEAILFARGGLQIWLDWPGKPKALRQPGSKGGGQTPDARREHQTDGKETSLGRVMADSKLPPAKLPKGYCLRSWNDEDPNPLNDPGRCLEDKPHDSFLLRPFSQSIVLE